MKRLLTAAAAAITLMGTMSAGAASAQPGDYGHHDDANRHDDQGQNHQWNDNQHNGYNYHGQWHYGPPPSNLQGRNDVQFGFHQWRRGDRLPSYYRTRYQEIDWRHDHLRAPPRGYHYVRDERGETLLVGIATGAILSAILNH